MNSTSQEVPILDREPVEKTPLSRLMYQIPRFTRGDQGLMGMLAARLAYELPLHTNPDDITQEHAEAIHLSAQFVRSQTMHRRALSRNGSTPSSAAATLMGRITKGIRSGLRFRREGCSWEEVLTRFNSDAFVLPGRVLAQDYSYMVNMPEGFKHISDGFPAIERERSLFVAHALAGKTTTMPEFDAIFAEMRHTYETVAQERGRFMMGEELREMLREVLAVHIAYNSNDADRFPESIRRTLVGHLGDLEIFKPFD